MSSSRKNRKRKRRSTTNRNTTPVSEQSSEPKYVTICKQLLNQITGLDDSKPFHTVLSSRDRLYNEYHKLNSKPISFKTVRDRLYQKPCHYSSYDKFNEDIAKIFYQETRLKNYKGSSADRVKKRVQNAKRTENYWNTLTASYTQYGFDTIMNAKSNDSDDSKEGDNKPELRKKKKESKKQKKHKKVLSNIKKRVKRSSEPSALEPPQPPFKRRRLNDNRMSPRNTSKPPRNKEELDDDEDAKQEMDEEKEERHKKTPSGAYMSEGQMTDSPFTPFAEKSRVFNDVMGNTEDLFRKVGGGSGTGDRRRIKKILCFELDDHKNHNKYTPPVEMHKFEIKWRYDDVIHHREPRTDVIEAPRMDTAVKEFKGTKCNEQLIILSVKLILY